MASGNLARPFEPAQSYTKVHNAVFTLYTRLPDFKADHAMLYIYLMARYNPDYGYAFPSTEDIALALNCGVNQVTQYKRALRKYELIDVKRLSAHGNDVYFIHAPIVEEAEFYRRFPEAREYYDRRRAQMAQRKLARTDEGQAAAGDDMDAIRRWL